MGILPITGDYCYPVLSGGIQNLQWEHPLAHRVPICPLRIGAQDTKIPAMSFPYTLRSLPDTKLVSDEEQVQS
jgi:hypothetical protein